MEGGKYSVPVITLKTISVVSCVFGYSMPQGYLYVMKRYDSKEVLHTIRSRYGIQSMIPYGNNLIFFVCVLSIRW